MREAAIDFLDRFDDNAIALGSTVTDRFGVHPTIGMIRVDYCGGLIINARRVEAIGDTWIRYGNQTYRRDRPGRPAGVPGRAVRTSTTIAVSGMRELCEILTEPLCYQKQS